MSTRNREGSTAWQLLAPHVARIVQHAPGEQIESLAAAALDLAA
jgi:hypothetical protein